MTDEDLRTALDQALTLTRRAQRDRAHACAELGDVKAQLRDALIELNAAKALLAHLEVIP